MTKTYTLLIALLLSVTTGTWSQTEKNASTLSANKATLSWTVKEGNLSKLLPIKADYGIENVEVDWGDGNTKRFNGQGIWAHTPLSHIYSQAGDYTITINTTGISEFDCYNNQISSLDLSQCPELTSLMCDNNQLTTLDLKENKALTYLQCTNNRLTALDLKENKALTTLWCYGNQLPLSELYAASEQIQDPNNKHLGGQTLALQEIEPNTPLSLKGEMILGGVETNFVVTKEGSSTVLNTDYRLDYATETITFFSEGRYELTLSNTAITSHSSYPAEVIMPIQVAGPARVIFTWSAEADEKKGLTIRAVEGTENIEVDWGDGNTKRFSGGGIKRDVPLSHSYEEAGDYTVAINTTSLSYLDCKNHCRLSSLNLSQCPALTTLYCNNNQLTNLDISQCPALITLNCNYNRLPLSELYAASKLIQNANNKYLGEQTLALQEIEPNTPLSLKGEMILEGVESNIVVRKGRSPAVLDTDYRLDYATETITFLGEGRYEVTLRNTAIISHSSYPVIVILLVQVKNEVDIAEVAGKVDVKLYPNPMKEVLCVESPERVESLTIYDLSGRTVKQWIEPEESINVSELSKGTYLIRVNGKTTKVIKN